MASPTPHYVRFARAIALLGGLAGVSACAASTELDRSDAHVDADAARGDGGGDDDAGSALADAGALDAGAPVDSGHTCETCVCTFGTDAGPVVSCDSVGLEVPCCAAAGPLFPPDLPA